MQSYRVLVSIKAIEVIHLLLSLTWLRQTGQYSTCSKVVKKSLEIETMGHVRAFTIYNKYYMQVVIVNFNALLFHSSTPSPRERFESYLESVYWKVRLVFIYLTKLKMSQTVSLCFERLWIFWCISSNKSRVHIYEFVSYVSRLIRWT